MNTLESVREGMTVFDASGDAVGTVAGVKMGDPEAVTAEGQQSEGLGGIAGALVSAFDARSDLPEERRERLLRLGYIEIDGSGLGNNSFEAADAIDRVKDDGVFLTSSAAGVRD
ncbi:hypothetical protein FJV46_08655 [Arthrobacter agilis]|uniref:hypothetical protein n=1 Tax=Arthrobacter agilis TaxID=37921 RepID=UPI000B35FF6E|nr:hypothetical protein [Arthrobacter agilis]OUM43192.1 hypothetical protein B8W74_08180 [Arthrobacter agilis]PPB47674.1 hypothetical protein CI784_00680 [Arthrobacter agilis]TPV25676.1 hypothetical protein FJV46_08655 [Arthrobacter agilis]VDR33460.1 Uncharacterised protein [Arthrobacter agilis]